MVNADVGKTPLIRSQRQNEDASDDGDQVQHATDSRIELWRGLNFVLFHFSSFSESPFEYGVLHVLIDAAALAFSFHRCSFTPNTRSQKIVAAELSRPMSAAKRKAR